MEKAARINATTLHELLMRDDEIAVIDVREEGAFSRRHLLIASSAPSGRIEFLIGDLVRRADAPIVLCDEDETIADWSAARLANMGYSNVRVLEGGVSAWEAAGYALFDGVHVPSKAFGELVHETRHTPAVSASELREMLDGDTPPFLIDCRPKNEYAAWSLPGAIDLPGVELAYRLQAADVPQDRKLVINCAGRTRSIIGTQTLVDLGLATDVAALENGLMGWRLGGFETGDGGPGMVDNKSKAVQEVQLPEVSGTADAGVTAAVEALAERSGVTMLDWSGLDTLRSKSTGRTIYLLDVRTPEEFLAGHHPDAVSAPGGQLIQETDRYVGVRGAILVLVDDTGVRAKLTASWLKRLGWKDVYALPEIKQQAGLVSGPRRPQNIIVPDNVVWIDAAATHAKLEAGQAIALDLSLSAAHQTGHIPGAYFATRVGLQSQLAALAQDREIILVSEDGILAALTVGDGMDWGGRAVCVLKDGMAAWRDAGNAVETGMPDPLTQMDDRWWQPDRHPDGMTGFMRDYLTWEVGLVARVLQDGTARYAHDLIT